MDSNCQKVVRIFEELDSVAPDAPFLALGQTVFWDEAMKSGLAVLNQKMGSNRRFVVGIHDTDYFAKSHSVKGSKGFAALPHNDTTTKDLWSAAGEFSALFGAEIVITKEKLLKGGAKVGKVEHSRPAKLDQLTEAWGWRGVVGLNRDTRITAEKQTRNVFPALQSTLEWAIDESLKSVACHGRPVCREQADRLVAIFCDTLESPKSKTISGLYELMLDPLWEFVAGEKVNIETTATTQLLKFNTQTADLKRFEIVDRFLNPKTKDAARNAYDDSVRGSEIYTLDRFGTGALPFDLFIPGVGRGTLRIGNRGGVVNTPEPVGFSFKKPITSVRELAEVLEAKFGPDIVLVGKAVSLILMLAREFVFVFHEGASSYIHRSAAMSRALMSAGYGLYLNPILRIKYAVWDALIEVDQWFRLPEPFQRPYGARELSAKSFAQQWREVGATQVAMRGELALCRRPMELVSYLQSRLSGQWESLATEYQAMQHDLSKLSCQISKVKEKKQFVLEELKDAKAHRNETQHELGRHWREKIWEKNAQSADWEDRTSIQKKLERIDGEIIDLRIRFRELVAEQDSLVAAEDIIKMRERRSEIAMEAELMRMELIRESVICMEGLEQSNRRPAAWWVPVVSPNGDWFRSIVGGAELRLEPLV